MADRSPVFVEPNGDPTNSILELSAVKDELRLAGSEEDTRLNRILDAVADTIENSLGRPVRKRQYYAYFQCVPENHDSLLLPQTPIISIDGLAALHNGVWVDVPTTEYRVTRTWNNTLPPPPGPAVIDAALEDGWTEIEHDDVSDPFRVTYTAGWDPMPQGIVDGTMKLAVDRFVLKGTLVDVEQYRTGTVVQTMMLQYKRPRTLRFIP